jgi:hypothetical protein
MSSTLHVRSVVVSAFCVLDQYTLEHFGRLRSTRGEGACGVSACGGDRGQWNEWRASLMDSWGSSGKALGLWTQKYEE